MALLIIVGLTRLLQLLVHSFIHSYSFGCPSSTLGTWGILINWPGQTDFRPRQDTSEEGVTYAADGSTSLSEAIDRCRLASYGGELINWFGEYLPRIAPVGKGHE